MSVENPQQRSDDIKIAVLCQTFNDFAENSIKVQAQILGEIKELRDKTFNLSCKVHDQRLEDIGKAVVGLWIIVGAIGIAVLTEWIRFLK